jgi:hypothetical protein
MADDEDLDRFTIEESCLIRNTQGKYSNEMTLRSLEAVFQTIFNNIKTKNDPDHETDIDVRILNPGVTSMCALGELLPNRTRIVLRYTFGESKPWQYALGDNVGLVKNWVNDLELLS